jgi:hypothetical protein
VNLILLDEALTELAEFDPKQAKIIELKFFAGLTNEDIAEILGVSVSTSNANGELPKRGCTTNLKDKIIIMTKVKRNRAKARS